MPLVKRPTKPKVTSAYNIGERTYYDAFRRKAVPDASILVREYKRVAYTCANYNACGLVNGKLRLYLKTNKGESSVFRKETLFPVTTEKIDYLCSLTYLEKNLRSFVNVEEVVSHPILELLDKVNSTPYLNGIKLKELTQLYQEITGKSYWLITNDALGRPNQIWLLPSQYVRPVKENDDSKKIIDYYEYSPPGFSDSFNYLPNDIIPFLFPSLLSPYLDGLSPLQAAFEANEVNNKLLTHSDSILENEGRPDIILTHADKDAGGFGPDEAERLEKEFKIKFTRGRNGGVWVPTDPVEILPVNIPPRDLARLEINKWSKVELANAFDVPYALISDASHNRQQLEAAEVQHAKYSLRKRFARFVCTLNDQLLTRYDDTGRLFLAFDDPVPEDEEKKYQKIIQFVMNGIWTPNEGRNIDGTYGPSSDPNADKLRAANVAVDPKAARERRADSGDDNRRSNNGKREGEKHDDD